jgi:hypothetical protein
VTPAVVQVPDRPDPGGDLGERRRHLRFASGERRETDPRGNGSPEECCARGAVSARFERRRVGGREREREESARCRQPCLPASQGCSRAPSWFWDAEGRCGRRDDAGLVSSVYSMRVEPRDGISESVNQAGARLPVTRASYRLNLTRWRGSRWQLAPQDRVLPRNRGFNSECACATRLFRGSGLRMVRLTTTAVFNSAYGYLAYMSSLACY